MIKPHLKKYIFFLILFFPIYGFCQDKKSKGQTAEKENYFPQLGRLNQLLNKNEDQALALINQLLAQKTGFKTPKEEAYIKASALFARGGIELGKKDSLKALEDYKASATYNFRRAYYNVALFLYDRSKSTNDPKFLKQSEKYCVAGAELGEVNCILLLLDIYKTYYPVPPITYYWNMMYVMYSPSFVITDYKKTIQTYPQIQRQFLNDTFNEYSLVGSNTRSALKGLPGRTLLTSAYVERVLRASLGFYSEAFFVPSKDTNQNKLAGAFKLTAAGFKSGSPICRLYLLLNNKFQSKEKHFSFTSSTFIDNVLPADEILFTCGPINHYAQVWKVDKKNNKIFLIDPFYEFWQATLGNCIQHFKLADYKYNRQLVEIDAAEIASMAVAIFTVRDNKKI